jgi:hypothetical protein
MKQALYHLNHAPNPLSMSIFCLLMTEIFLFLPPERLRLHLAFFWGEGCF